MKRQFTMMLLMVVSLAGCGAPLPIPTQTVMRNLAEEPEIKSVVENFGKRLAMVSLQSALAPQDIKDQYSEFVSPVLLEFWMNNVSKAPGSVVSSPWPDRIEVTSLTKTASDKYVVTGSVVEITSVDMVKGGVADKLPVRIAVQKIQGRWVITEYAESR
jgi:hypothetical protein